MLGLLANTPSPEVFAALWLSYLSLKSWLWSSSCSSSVFSRPLPLSLLFLSSGSRVSTTTRLGWNRSLGQR